MSGRSVDAVEREWMWSVWRHGAFHEHWSDPVNTYGPFRTKAEAEDFVRRGGGTLYRHADLTFSDREVLGIWD